MTTDPEHQLRAAVDDAERIADRLPTGEMLTRITERRRRITTRAVVPAISLAAAAAALMALVDVLAAGPPTPEIAPPALADQPDEEVQAATGTDQPAADDGSVIDADQADADDGSVRDADQPDADAAAPDADTEIGPVDAPARGCSAAGLPSELAPQPLPAAVTELRAELAARAVSCDLDDLASLAAPHGFTYSYGGDGDPVGFWSRAERSGEEPGPVGALRLVLDAPPGLYEPVSAGDSSYWVWPRLATMHADEAGAEDLRAAIGEVVATGVHPRGLVEEMVHQHGGYIGYRLLIEVPADGSEPAWIAFVAGD